MDQMYRRLVELAYDGFWLLDKEFMTVYVNPAMEKMLGYSIGEMIGRSWYDFGDPAWVARARELEKRRECGVQEPHQFLFVHKDGRAVLTRIAVTPLYDGEGKFDGAIGVLSNLATDEALRESELLYKKLFTEAPLGIALIDSLTGEIYEANTMFAKIAGRTIEELAHIDWMSITHPDDVQKDLDNVALLNAGKTQGFQMEKRYLRHDGAAVWIRLTVAPVEVVDRAHPRHLCMIEEITDRKQAVEEIRCLNAELEQRVTERTAQLETSNKELAFQNEEKEKRATELVIANKELTFQNEEKEKRAAELVGANASLESFSYSISHDLRAPLRSIDGFSLALLEDYGDKLDEGGKDYLRRVRTATQKMAQLIDDILKLSRITRCELTLETVNLSELVGVIADELRSAEPERKVEFVIAKGLKTQGDSALLKVVLDNLIGNAWKFTGSHAVARIEFGSSKVDGKTACFIRDDGAGFDPKYADKLFVTFQRLHTEREFPGTGIGLSLVQHIIHRHGGTVWAEGAVEQGATFWFTVGG